MEWHNRVGTVFEGGMPEQEPLLLSRNEAASLCYKAVRGAGMSWGLAEEAGQAAAWLVQRGLDGPRNLADHLLAAANRPWVEICPEIRASEWSSRTGTPLCPIALGATLSDFAALPATPFASRGLTTSAVSRPVLVLPFLAHVAETLGTNVRVSWTGGAADIGRGGTVHGNPVDLADRERAALHIQSGLPVKGAAFAAPMARVDPNTLEKLNAFAMKTTVPPSDRSRDGAGSGTSDND